MDKGSRQTRKERAAVVEAWQNECRDQFLCSLGEKILPDRTNSTELVAAGFGGLTNEVLHGQCAVEEDAEAFVRVNERDCGIFKQWCWRKWRKVFVLFWRALLLSFYYSVEVCVVSSSFWYCYVSSSFWCPNNSQLILKWSAVKKVFQPLLHLDL